MHPVITQNWGLEALPMIAVCGLVFSLAVGAAFCLVVAYRHKLSSNFTIVTMAQPSKPWSRVRKEHCSKSLGSCSPTPIKTVVQRGAKMIIFTPTHRDGNKRKLQVEPSLRMRTKRRQETHQLPQHLHRRTKNNHSIRKRSSLRLFCMR